MGPLIRQYMTKRTLTIRKLVQLLWQRSKVRVPERVLGAYPVVRVQLQERTRHHLTLDNIVQPGKA